MDAVCDVNWTALFVRAGSEETVARRLEHRLDGALYTPFVPMKELGFVKGGVVRKKELILCFPGYVFIKAHGRVEDFYRDVQRVALSIENAYYFVHYGDDKRDIFVRREERTCIEELLNETGQIAGSTGFMEGDRVVIVSGALLGLESRIVRVNKVKRQAVVEMPFMGAVREITVMLEVVEKVTTIGEGTNER